MQEAQESISAMNPGDMFANRYEPETTFEATFSISTSTVGKGCYPCYLHTTNGPRLLCSYEPMEEYRALDGKRVVVTGRKYKLSPYVQQLSNEQHFSITSMHAK